MSEGTPKSKAQVRAEQFAATKLGSWLVIHVLSPLDRKAMLRTKGATKRGGAPTLLLHHVGAKTGQLRHTPIQYVAVDDHWVVVASKGGDPKNPGWYWNLKANPDTVIDVGGERIAVRARQVEGEEYRELWKRANAQYAGYAVYQKRAGSREIPILSLERR